MDSGRNPDLARAIAAALDWWRDAGVDCTFADEPTDWLARPDPVAPDTPDGTDAPPLTVAQVEAEQRTFAPRVPVHGAIDLSAMPGELAAFRDWWMSDPALDNGRTSGRVPPRGEAGAKLMLIVPEPEAEDNDPLLAGRQGKLVEAMLLAMGIAPDQAYFASALPRHTPATDWDAVAAGGLGQVLCRHVLLAAPQRIIVFGRNILPLFGHDPAQASAVLRSFNHEGISIPLLAARSIPALLERPRWKRDLWRAWLDWTK